MEDKDDNETKGPLVGYRCANCDFETDSTNCDVCDALVRWDNHVCGSAHCTGCGRYIGVITCRNCGHKFDL